MFQKRILLFIFFFLFVQTSIADEPPLTVITLQHRQAHEIIEAVQPFIAPPGQIKAFQDQLIIQTTPENLAEIRTLINKLDQTIPQLVIFVTQSQEKPTDTKLMFLEHQQDNHRTTTQKVRVLSGNIAHIQTGQVKSLGILGEVRIESGFYVKPVLSGQQVLLSISAHDDTPARKNRYHTASTNTTITAPLDQWIDLGSIETETTQHERAFFIEGQQKKQENYHIWLRVQLAQ